MLLICLQHGVYGGADFNYGLWHFLHYWAIVSTLANKIGYQVLKEDAIDLVTRLTDYRIFPHEIYGLKAENRNHIIVSPI